MAKVWLEELKAEYDAALEAAKAAGNTSKQPHKEGEATSIKELAELIVSLGPDSLSE